jgi:endoglucanase
MVRFLKKTAIEHNIKWQPEILTGGGTDTAGVQRKGQNGSIAGALSIPTRHIHQSIEMSNIADIRATIDLLKQAVLEIDTYDWSFK